MFANPTNTLKSMAQRHYLVVAFAVVLTSIALWQTGVEPEKRDSIPVVSVATSTIVTNVVSGTMPAAEPVRLRIPTIGVDAAFEEPLGLQRDQSIEVPVSFTDVGYYKYGPTPGELGPAVVLGHVDSYEGPAVLWSLGELNSGDHIFIDRADGTAATFTVTTLERHEQAGFPTRQVYGDIDHAGLRLITCSGTYDRDRLRYSHNLIVFAELQTTDE